MKMKFKGELIRTLAKRNKISITKLAKMIGVSRVAIHLWINGDCLPHADSFILMCKIFKENPHNFFEMS
jgi:transcriptional regulator with XRE-family HTH domain